MPDLKHTGLDMVSQAMQVVDPHNLIMEQVKQEKNILVIQGRQRIALSEFEHIYVIGAGKGTAPMAAAMESLLGNRLTDGAIVVKYEHRHPLQKIRLYEAGHPVPDENTLKHTGPLLEIAGRAGEKDLVFVLITGGGSALMESLPDGITLEDLAETNQQLLSCGATIQQINTIRKHISRVKGGRLAARIWPAKTISLILSDVIGDPLESIASGPTAPDPATFRDALNVIDDLGLKESLPEGIREHLRAGVEGRIEDTPDSSSEIFSKVQNMIIGNNRLVLERVSRMAAERGIRPLILTDRVQGEAREIARLIAGILQSCRNADFPVEPPACIIMGGEPTVTIRGEGKGGRNQELTLALLRELGELREPYFFCSVGTDGTDGPTDAAGAWIDQETMHKVKAQSLDIMTYLNNNDSYHFFDAIGQLVKTGPTRTNVMDLIVGLIG